MEWGQLNKRLEGSRTIPTHLESDSFYSHFLSLDCKQSQPRVAARMPLTTLPPRIRGDIFVPCHFRLSHTSLPKEHSQTGCPKEGFFTPGTTH